MDQGWRQFMETGKIEDYLRYKRKEEASEWGKDTFRESEKPEEGTDISNR